MTAAAVASDGSAAWDRTVIPHVDDLGASHGANAAFLQLAASGRVTCGAVMVPGPWFREIAEACAADPRLDVGVHLTLTSEWRGCRWAPISTVRRSSGLIDADGYFWRDLASLRSHFVPEAATQEMRAQVKRAISAGMRPTHLDSHMAAAMLPGLLEAQLDLAREFGLMPILPRSIGWAPSPTAYQRCLAALEAAGAPIIDHCRGTLPVARGALEPGWRALVADLPSGITHLALHCTRPGDFAAMAPDHAAWREHEFSFIRDGGLTDACARAGVGIAGTRGLQASWQAYASGHKG